MQESPAAKPPAPVRASLSEVAWLFLRLGATAFGGPAAHIGMMEEEVVRRRRWLTHEEFLDLLGAVNLIPGPNSTEMALHIGGRVAGVAGFFVAGVCFILPAALLVGGLAWAYEAYHTLPAAAGLLYGVKPVVLAIILQALWNLGRKCVRSAALDAVGQAAVVLAVLGVDELLVLLVAGIALALAQVVRRLARGGRAHCFSVAGLPSLPLAATAGGTGTTVGLWPLFLVFLKIGSVLFGGGYVLLAFLQAELVDKHGWLTQEKLLDAVAAGQVTPGPLFTAATFVGYVVAGPWGAVVATVGIFLPAFVFVAVSGPLIPRLRRSPAAGAFLDGVNVASLALMAVVTGRLATASVVDVPTALLAAGAALLLMGFRVNSVWLIFLAGLAGLLLRRG
jgi:chromate transporter